MNPKPSNPNKAKHKSRRKAEETRRQNARSNTLKTIEKWNKEYYESRQEYPVTKKKRKRLTKEQFRKMLRSK